MKTCLRCKENKSLDMFHKDKTRKDGYFSYCKVCSNKLCRARQPLRSQTESYKQSRLIAQKKYVQANKQVSLAHRLAREIPLPELCEDCGIRKSVHRHHPDYSKPQEVVALCVSCHEKAHHGVIV